MDRRGEARRAMTIDNVTQRPAGGSESARVYDYFIGGDSGLEADRSAGAWIRLQAPDLLAAMQENRFFLSRAVRWLSRQGVDQFIDIGSGFPVSPNTHEIALSASPSGSVVYCDVDHAVGQRTRALIAGTKGADFVQADIQNPEELLAQPAIQKLIRSGRPVACVLAAVLHFVPEDADPEGITAVLRESLPSGSYLVVSHIAGDIPWADRNNAETLERAFEDMYPRTRAQVTEFFGDFELVAPGVVPAARWQPAEGMSGEQSDLAIYAGVGRKA
ncbi:SAM-dependent methyltransferase [Streptomyces sp. CC0208]|uniref:SAM-dependent methyltransferase n=1 Tax=Streptomyces sp. CC0208 TaxID=2306165 RepID=UPI0013C40C9F|nr:SAM-dependent methyltransferase [Streptomyces sp. CC0208]